MPYKEKTIEKVYFSISEVAERFEVAPSLIRFWEREFEMLHPKKGRGGNRMFTRDDLEVFQIIFHLVKEKGYTLEGARNQLRHHRKGTNDEMQVVSTLKKMRAFLKEIQDEI